jgi:two-component system NtrC family response regulator
VRELQNVLESAIQISSDSEISKDFIERNLSSRKVMPIIETENMLGSYEQHQKERIVFYLKKFDNNKSKTAQALGISRKTLYKRLREFNFA